MVDRESPGVQPRTGAVSRGAAGSPTQSRLKVAIVASGLVLLLAAVGFGGYLLGRSSGEDLSAARDAGASAGRVAGQKKGSAEGFAAGYSAGRKRGYEQTFASSYKAAYKEAFKKAGLTPPDQVTVPSK